MVVLGGGGADDGDNDGPHERERSARIVLVSVIPGRVEQPSSGEDGQSSDAMIARIDVVPWWER